MALNVESLAAMSTVELVKLRDQYVAKRRDLPRMLRRHTPNLVTDIRSVDDTIRTINEIVQMRQRRRTGLSTFTT